MMLGKELLSGLWVRPECRSYWYSSYRRSFSPFVSPFPFSPLCCDDAVFASKCTGVKLCLNGCTLWSLGSWLGGSWVSARSLVASRTRQWPSCFFVVGARCLSAGRTWDSRVDQQGFEPPPAVCQRWQDQRHTNWAIGSPTPMAILCFCLSRCCFVLFSFSMASVDDGTEAAIPINPFERTAVPWWLVSFVCWLCFGWVCFCVLCRCFAFWFLFRVWVFLLRWCHHAMGLPIGLCTGSLSLLLWPSHLDSLACNLPIQLPASTNLLNDLAKAMKALDGKKTKATKEDYCEALKLNSWGSIARPRLQGEALPGAYSIGFSCVLLVPRRHCDGLTGVLVLCRHGLLWPIFFFQDALISGTWNMQCSVLIDLAKAKRRWKEKKILLLERKKMANPSLGQFTSWPQSRSRKDQLRPQWLTSPPPEAHAWWGALWQQKAARQAIDRRLDSIWDYWSTCWRGVRILSLQIGERKWTLKEWSSPMPNRYTLRSHADDRSNSKRDKQCWISWWQGTSWNLKFSNLCGPYPSSTCGRSNETHAKCFVGRIRPDRQDLSARETWRKGAKRAPAEDPSRPTAAPQREVCKDNFSSGSATSPKSQRGCTTRRSTKQAVNERPFRKVP